MIVQRHRDPLVKPGAASVPDAVDRVMVAPAPSMVTFAVMTGRPVPPSVALLALVSV